MTARQSKRVLPGVSVITTVLNERSACARLMMHLESQTVLPEEFVIVDGGSSDGTREVLQTLAESNSRIRVIDAPGCNIAEGRNIGIRKAFGDVLACTDSGSCPESDWLEKICEPFENPDVKIVGGNYCIAPENRFEEVSGLLTMPGALQPINPERFNPSGRSIAFRRSTWQMAGGYPEWLYTAEDTLFDLKCRRMGCQFAFAKDAVVQWRPRTGWRSTGKQFLNYARGEARIGRGEEDSLFWISRYAIGLMSLLTGTTFSLCGGGSLVAFVGLILGLLVVSKPHFAIARQVVRKTGRRGDWLLSVLLNHWIVAHRIVGYSRGEKDRLREPGRYIGNLLQYYLQDRVSSSNPPWPMESAEPSRTLVVSWYWPPTNRASSNVIGSLFSAAPKSSFKVLTRQMQEPGVENAVSRPPVDVHSVPWVDGVDGPPSNRSWLMSIVTVIRLVRAARQIHDDWNVQRVLLIYPHRFGLLAGRLIARMLGVPFAAWMHDLHVETLVTKSWLKKRFWMKLDESIVRDADFLAVPSREMAEHYERRGCESTMVLAHCRPPGMKKAPVCLSGDELNLLYSGNLYEAHEDAIRSAIEALDGMPGTKLTFFSPQHRLLEGQKRQWLPRQKAIEGLAEADAALVVLGFDTPYPEEIRVAFPSKLVDAVCLGKPVLAVAPPDSFLVRFVRETKCGIAVDSLDVEAIREGNKKLQDPDEYACMAENARRVAMQLEPEIWMDRLVQSLRDRSPAETSDWEKYVEPIPVSSENRETIENMAGVQ